MALEDKNGKYVRIEKLEIDFSLEKAFIQTQRYRSKTQRENYDERFHKKIIDDIVEVNKENGLSNEKIDQYLNTIKSISIAKIQVTLESEFEELKDKSGSFVNPFSLESPFFLINKFLFLSLPIKRDPSRVMVQLELSVYENKESFDLIKENHADHEKPFNVTINLDMSPQIGLFIEEMYEVLKGKEKYSTMTSFS